MVLRRWLIAVHRWLGVGLCLVVLTWFSSGVAMIFWEFPAVEEADRLARLPALDSSRIHVSAADAFSRLGWSSTPTRLVLNTFDGRPAYRFHNDGGDAVVYADTGTVQRALTKDILDRIASGWTGLSSRLARVDAVDDVDQWTVQESIRDLRPLWKYSWPTGEQVYVSGVSGEVVQSTTTTSRRHAYLGPIPHWLYFTPLRNHATGWRRLVIWFSGASALTALIGIAIGVSALLSSRRYVIGRAARHLPYRGVRRWHVTIGLAMGVVVASWTFSGMLSMDPFPFRTSGPSPDETDLRVRRALRGPLALSAFGNHGLDALVLRANPPITQLEWVVVGTEPAYVATLAGGGSRVVQVERGSAASRLAFDRLRIAHAVADAVRPSTVRGLREIDRYDAYYRDRRRKLPLPVLVLTVDNSSHAQYYIDPRSAAIVGAYSTRDWTARWLYHGLHSLDFPWLADHRPAWDLVILTLLIAGVALSATSVVLGWRAAIRRGRRAADRHFSV